jgi:hypothetical protein
MGPKESVSTRTPAEEDGWCAVIAALSLAKSSMMAEP